jgi:hypothetical protein
MGTAVCSARQHIGKSRLPGAQPLVLRRLRAFVFKVLDRERVAALQHLEVVPHCLAIACRSSPSRMRSEIIPRRSEDGVAAMKASARRASIGGLRDGPVAPSVFQHLVPRS